MKIVMLCDLHIPTLRYQDNYLSKYYIKHGHEVTVIASTYESVFDYMSNNYNKKIAASEQIVDHVKIIKLPYSKKMAGKIRRFSGVETLLEREKPDLIFLDGFHLNTIEAANYKKKNPSCKIVLEYHADYSNTAKNWLKLTLLHKLIKRNIFNSVSKYIDRIYPVVPAGFVFLNEVYKVPYERMTLLPLGADTDLFNQVIAQNKGKLIREKFKIPIKDIVIFTGGKLEVAKKTHLLVEAFLKINNPQLHLIVVGEPQGNNHSYLDELKTMCRKNVRVYFTGWLSGDDVCEYMNASDFAVFPASQSALWQQAIGMGLPLIVGSGVEGKYGDQNPSYLNKNNNLIVIDRHEMDVEKLAENINLLTNDRELLDSMKKGALKTAAEFLSFDKIVQQTLEFDSKK